MHGIISTSNARAIIFEYGIQLETHGIQQGSLPLCLKLSEMPNLVFGWHFGFRIVEA